MYPLLPYTTLLRAGVHATSCCSRLVTEALMDANGVRRSWETARSSAVRSRSAAPTASSWAASRRSAWRSIVALNWERNRSEEHTSELQYLMRISYAVFYLEKKKNSDIIEVRA